MDASLNQSYKYDAVLFRKAQLSINEALESFSSLSSSISSVKTGFPDNFEYKDDVLSACEKIEKANSKLITYSERVQHLCDDLSNLHKSFGEQVKQRTSSEEIKDALKGAKADWKKGFSSLAHGKGFKDLKEAYLNTEATVVVGKAAAKRGIYKVGENIADAGRMVKAGFQTGAKREATLDKIREDRTQKRYEEFFNTKAGKAINARSYIKSDSATANQITKYAQKGTDLALATGLTIVSGGLATGGAGMVVGMGRGAEQYAQSVDRESGEKYDYKKAVWSSVKSGTATSVKYVVSGSMVKTGGEFIANGGFKTLASSVGKIAADPKSAIAKVVSKETIKEGVKNTVKSQNFIATSSAKVTSNFADVGAGYSSVGHAIKRSATDISESLFENAEGSAIKGGTTVLEKAEKKVMETAVDIGRKILGETDAGQTVNKVEKRFVDNVINDPLSAVSAGGFSQAVTGVPNHETPEVLKPFDSLAKAYEDYKYM